MADDYLNNPANNQRGGIIQSPELTTSGEAKQRSIRDIQMARDVVNTIIQASRNRSIVAARIMAKYNAERPYDSYRLEAEGLGWKQNFTTKPLGQMVEKVAPRLVEAANGLKYLTNSSLSENWDNYVEKTEKFRKKITSVIRTHPDFQTLLEDVALNDSMFGYTAVAWLDEYGWFPDHFQFDQFFLPDGTKQSPLKCQAAIFKEVLLPHELYQRIFDREAAETAGYDIKESVAVINEAAPQQLRDRLNLGGTLEFWYQNAYRELTIGATYTAGNNIVTVYHLLVREVDGKISHYQMAGEGMRKIFEREDQFESAQECMSFFSYQKGNGTMHGSKGIGRELYELAGMIDRNRNEIVDRSILAGKILVQGDVRRLQTYKMSIVGMTCIIPDGWEISSQKIDGDIEPSLKLDAYFSMLSDQLIGNTSPPPTAVGEGMRSPAAWNLLAAREEEAKDNRISRFLKQLANMVQTMQRRICSKNTDDEDAKEARAELLKIMSPEELDELANCPVVETVADLTPMERQNIAAVVAEKKGNPIYNQRALEVEDLTARIGAEFADKVLLPDNDPTEQAEQERLQQMEMELLDKGESVPVSVRDNPLIHLSVIFPKAEQVAANIGQGGAPTQLLEVYAAHMLEHINFAKQAGIKAETLKPYTDFERKIGPVLQKLKELDQQAAQLQQQSAAHDSQNLQDTQQQAPPPGLQPQ